MTRLLAFVIFLLPFSVALAQELPTVREIHFNSEKPVREGDLLRILPIRVGEPLPVDGLDKSKAALLKRDIFAAVEATMTPVANGVSVSFDIVPRFTIGEVNFSGQEVLDERTLRRLSGLRLGEVFHAEDIEAAQQRILQGYLREGIPTPEIHLDIVPRSDAAQFVIQGTIAEGVRLKIVEVRFNGSVPPEIRDLPQQLSARVRGAFATAKNLKEVRQELLAAVRQEGYLQASLNVHYDPLPDRSDGVCLTVDLETRLPISIEFHGNRRFTVEELLEPLKLKSRTVPFTPAAIETLCREIQKMYEEGGYYFTQVSSRDLGEQQGRHYYEINIDQGPRTHLREVSFAGNSALPDGVLREAIDKVGQREFSLFASDDHVSRELLAAQTEALERLYEDRGYLGTKATFEVTPTEDRREVDVRYSIQEATRKEVRDVLVEWRGISSELLQRPALAEVMNYQPKLRRGDTLRQSELETERDQILEQLRGVGFPLAQVEVDTSHIDREIRFIATPGPLVTVGNITIAGNVTTHDEVIARALTVASGTPYRNEDLRASERVLAQLGLFRAVSITPADGKLDGPSEDVIVHVTERDSGLLEVGSTVSTEDGFHVFSEISQRNVGGHGDTVQLGVNGYVHSGGHILDAGHARALYLQPRFLGTPLTWSVETSAQYALRVIDPYRLDRTGVSTALRGNVSDTVNGSVGLVFSDEQTSEVPTDMIIGPNDAGNTLVSAVRGDLDWDLRDDQANPRKGFRTQLRARVSTEALGSTVNFAELSAQETVLLPLARHLVWANGLRGTVIEPFGNTDVIPLAERLFLGGRNSLRGFSRNAIGPRGFDGDILGGDRSLVFNSELQLDLTENLVGVTFVDVGQAFLEHRGSFDGNGNSLSDIRVSPGVGVRYKTPVGPLSLELGLATDRQNGERWGRFLFAIGNPF